MERFDVSIYNAVSTEQLRGLRDRMHFELRPSLFDDVMEWNRSVNAAHDRLIAGTIALAEQTLRLEGFGVPPVPYAFVAVGSAGRMEQTLWSDQDNGIVYAEPPDGKVEETADYFRLFSDRVHGWLQSAGYPPCPGNVLCTNSAWRKPKSAWIDMIQGWLDDPQWENVRYLLMIADLRCIHGDAELVRELRSAYLLSIAENPAMLDHMLQNTLYHKITIGVLGNIITERYGEDAGAFDVKYGAYIPLVNGIRLLALADGISEFSTLDRLKALRDSGNYAKADVDRWCEAFVTALELRSLAQHEKDGVLYTSRGMIDPESLTKQNKRRLKQCLRTGIELQQTVRRTVEKMADGTPKKRGGSG
ncbi:MAG: putative nucleotidyltransferase [Paenibacillus sp.]|jgi:CBS domain-containing protein|nr:putative nucleotidyltransferase [Paenibacillus sp.]